MFVFFQFSSSNFNFQLTALSWAPSSLDYVWWIWWFGFTFSLQWKCMFVNLSHIVRIHYMVLLTKKSDLYQPFVELLKLCCKFKQQYPDIANNKKHCLMQHWREKGSSSFYLPLLTHHCVWLPLRTHSLVWRYFWLLLKESHHREKSPSDLKNVKVWGGGGLCPNPFFTNSALWAELV